MLQKLDEVEARYEELTAQLADVEIHYDISRMNKIAKERASIAEVVETYRQYKKRRKEQEDLQNLLGEKDEEIRQLVKDELPALKAEILRFEERLKILLLPKDPNDQKNILLEIRAGTGGEEAALFAADLFRMYGRFAENQRWHVEVLSQHETGTGGLKEIIALIEGTKVYSVLKYESGVHRVQRVPMTEAQGRIHTSTVTVAVLPEAEDVDVHIDDKDLRIDNFRSSGCGGQHVNTTDSAIRITHLPTGMVVTCQDERSQHKNKAKAMKILRSRLLEMKQQEQEKERIETRRSMVGSGDRSERIRTYNFPQNRLTDHRIGLTIYKLSMVMEGDLKEIIESLQTYFQAEALKASIDA